MLTHHVIERRARNKSLHDGVNETPVAAVAQASRFQRLSLVIQNVRLQESSHLGLSLAEAHGGAQIVLHRIRSGRSGFI